MGVFLVVWSVVSNAGLTLMFLWPLKMLVVPPFSREKIYLEHIWDLSGTYLRHSW